jgi:peptidoglycan/LPS O-acetylase OafA/YrhL
MLGRPPRRSAWRSTRTIGLRRARVDAFRVYAILLVILGHSEFALGATGNPVVGVYQLALNVVGRVAVPLFLILAGEHLGPRLLRGHVRGAAWPYVRRLVGLFLAGSAFYLLVDLAKLVRSRGVDAGAAAFVARDLSSPVLLVTYGPRPHLWFLVVLTLVVIAAAAILSRSRVRTFVLVSAVLYGAGLAIGPYAPGLGLQQHDPWFEWALQSPLFFSLGIVLGLERLQERHVTAAIGLILGGLAIHCFEVTWLTTAHGTSPFRLAMLLGTVLYAGGTGMLALTPGAGWFERLVARASPYVPTVYLTHAFFIETLRPPPGVFPDLLVRVVVPIATIGLAFGSAWVLARLRHRILHARRRRAAGEPGPSPEAR